VGGCVCEVRGEGGIFANPSFATAQGLNNSVIATKRQIMAPVNGGDAEYEGNGRD
jgi:hypothetical protein